MTDLAGLQILEHRCRQCHRLTDQSGWCPVCAQRRITYTAGGVALAAAVSVWLIGQPQTDSQTDWVAYLTATGLALPALIGLAATLAFKARAARLVQHLHALNEADPQPEVQAAIHMIRGRPGFCRSCSGQLYGEWCPTCSPRRQTLVTVLVWLLGVPGLGIFMATSGVVRGSDGVGMVLAIFGFVYGVGGALTGLLLLFSRPSR